MLVRELGLGVGGVIDMDKGVVSGKVLKIKEKRGKRYLIYRD